MIERMGAAFADNIKGPRVLKTHFHHYNIPKYPDTKYIYCVRNPKDCLTSYFHHNRNFKIYNWANGTWDVFLDLFASGQLAFGDYFEHLLSWLPCLKDDNVLFLKYEDMFQDLENAVYKVILAEKYAKHVKIKAKSKNFVFEICFCLIQKKKFLRNFFGKIFKFQNIITFFIYMIFRPIFI